MAEIADVVGVEFADAALCAARRRIRTRFTISK
jgi:hypothetical protein